MGRLVATETPLDGLLVIEPQVFRDDRGYFIESYNKQDYAKIGINAEFVQDNENFSVRGVVRGMHMQRLNPQAKLVRVASGQVYDVVVDVRKESKTFGQWFGIELSCENKKQLFIPEGFLHGFQVLSKSTILLYKCTDFYNPLDERGAYYADPDLSIKWKPFESGEPILSEKDANNPPFAQLQEELCLD